ncbi:DNA excision repair protein ERCC-6-like [Quaeritorhiza haematococci]|nr:DNA excision repair protein ERCC-6-like [Quaeritorhiza haematococci]
MVRVRHQARDNHDDRLRDDSNTSGSPHIPGGFLPDDQSPLSQAKISDLYDFNDFDYDLENFDYDEDYGYDTVNTTYDATPLTSPRTQDTSTPDRRFDSSPLSQEARASDNNFETESNDQCRSGVKTPSRGGLPQVQVPNTAERSCSSSLATRFLTQSLDAGDLWSEKDTASPRLDAPLNRSAPGHSSSKSLNFGGVGSHGTDAAVNQQPTPDGAEMLSTGTSPSYASSVGADGGDHGPKSPVHERQFEKPLRKLPGSMQGGISGNSGADRRRINRESKSEEVPSWREVEESPANSQGSEAFRTPGVMFSESSQNRSAPDELNISRQQPKSQDNLTNTPDSDDSSANSQSRTSASSIIGSQLEIYAEDVQGLGREKTGRSREAWAGHDQRQRREQESLERNDSPDKLRDREELEQQIAQSSVSVATEIGDGEHEISITRQLGDQRQEIQRQPRRNQRPDSTSETDHHSPVPSRNKGKAPLHSFSSANAHGGAKDDRDGADPQQRSGRTHRSGNEKFQHYRNSKRDSDSDEENVPGLQQHKGKYREPTSRISEPQQRNATADGQARRLYDEKNHRQHRNSAPDPKLDPNTRLKSMFEKAQSWEDIFWYSRALKEYRKALTFCEKNGCRGKKFRFAKQKIKEMEGILEKSKDTQEFFENEESGMFELPGILGDDMGMGKTIQVIAFLSGLFECGLCRQVLIVMPLTLLDTWKTEFKKCIYTDLKRVLKKGGVCLTTYGMVIPHNILLALDDDEKWDYVILDEGHQIKNPSAKKSIALRQIPAEHKLLLTGTPIQNNLGELWSLFDYVCNGKLLGTSISFKKHFEQHISKATARDATTQEKQLAESLGQQLRDIINPYFKRREKKSTLTQHTETSGTSRGDSASSRATTEHDKHGQGVSAARGATSISRGPGASIGRKNELTVWIKLRKRQIKLYKEFLTTPDVHAVLNRTQSPLAAIGVLTKICDHPALLSSTSSLDDRDAEVLIEQSAKLKFMLGLLGKLIEKGHRTLIFSQSKRMLDIIQIGLVHQNIKFVRIDGSIAKHQERQRQIDVFNNDRRIPCFLLTTQIGLGITLTAADRVIIYPVEIAQIFLWYRMLPKPNHLTQDMQAVDRAYRVGQTQDVIVYRFMTCGTVEEKIYRNQIRKGHLFKAATDKGNNVRYFKKSELVDMFTLDDTFHSKTAEYLSQIHRPNLSSSPEDPVARHFRTVQAHIDNDIMSQDGLVATVSHHDLLYSKSEHVAIDPVIDQKAAQVLREFNNEDRESGSRGSGSLTGLIGRRSKQLDAPPAQGKGKSKHSDAHSNNNAHDEECKLEDEERPPRRPVEKQKPSKPPRRQGTSADRAGGKSRDSRGRGEQGADKENGEPHRGSGNAVEDVGHVVTTPSLSPDRNTPEAVGGDEKGKSAAVRIAGCPRHLHRSSVVPILKCRCVASHEDMRRYDYHIRTFRNYMDKQEHYEALRALLDALNFCDDDVRCHWWLVKLKTFLENWA